MGLGAEGERDLDKIALRTEFCFWLLLDGFWATEHVQREMEWPCMIGVLMEDV
jgi:hypothetical protein